ncbi:MAG: hypothetical protein AB1733_20785 [Thermodesulfobacteriota bacterium]
MNPTDSSGNSTGDSYPDAELDFETGLKRARLLHETGEHESAIRLLEELEHKYVYAVEVFDILGDALLAKGDVAAGIRYKTVHQVLKGTFRIIGDRSPRQKSIPVVDLEAAQTTEEEAGREVIHAVTPAEVGEVDESVVPITRSMAQQLMSQGHYDRAAGILDRLVLQNPDDDSLRKTRDVARRKQREKRLLEVFQRWLGNIEQMKASESSPR